MRVESKNDIRLIGRAIREGWDIDRKAIVKALMEPVENRDPDLMLKAAELLLKADKLNVDREGMADRRDKEHGDKRLQLLELAQRIPASELARLASDNGICVEGTAIATGRAAEPAGTDGTQASGGTRPKNTASGRRKPSK